LSQSLLRIEGREGGSRMIQTTSISFSLSEFSKKEPPRRQVHFPGGDEGNWLLPLPQWFPFFKKFISWRGSGIREGKGKRGQKEIVEGHTNLWTDCTFHGRGGKGRYSQRKRVRSGMERTLFKDLIAQRWVVKDPTEREGDHECNSIYCAL
jgi:hypothetical protein